MLKAHKPDMIAAWAKENKIKNWEHYYRSYDSKEVNKRRHSAMKSYNQRQHENINRGKRT